MPFVQGRLQDQPVSVTVETECAHCHQPLRLEVDSRPVCRALDAGAQPLVFAPMVNFAKLKDPSIVDAF